MFINILSEVIYFRFYKTLALNYGARLNAFLLNVYLKPGMC